MKELTPEYIDRFEEWYKAGEKEQAKTELAEMHPADIAEIIAEIHDDDVALFILELLDDEQAADTLMELDEDERKPLLDRLSNEQIAKRMLEHLDTDDAVDLIQELDKEDQAEVIKHIDDVEQAGDIIDLMKYDEDTAGGLMGTEMIVVNENWSMPECIKQMRLQAEDMDEIYNVYVVDDDNRLRGVLPLKKMVTHPSVSKIKHVIEDDPVSVTTDTPIDEVALLFEKYDLVAMPVIDSIGRLVGRITVDDIMDEVREQSERDYQLASGIATDVESDDSIFAQTKARLPWLLIGMIGGITTSLTIGSFGEDLMRVLPGVALFMTLIGGTGGNVGTQSSAIVVQGLASGSLDIKRAGRYILKELCVALFNALIISAIVFIYNTLRPVGDMHQAHVLTVAVSASLFCVVIFASVFGTIVPLTFEKLKIDPAIATGPFISITNDIVGIWMYLHISSLLYYALL